MQRIIVGTAGHVDHGKTVLTRRLTGIDTDRLKEEKERGISIELGFAPLTLPSGTKVGLIDVPGHERFIKNMLAGVAGIDLVLLVIAADEGLMPQTREHLDIINLLEVKKGIVVITKADLVDQEWLDLVQQEVAEALVGSVLENAPMIAVSAMNGQNMPELLETIDQMAQDIVPKEVTGKVRIPIDRIFSITGFGTVVTGTLWSGRIKVGDTVEILPGGSNVRVRTLQVHGEKVEETTAGHRVAVNLAGIEMEEIQRGDVLAAPGLLESSFRVDASLNLLSHVENSLKQRARVRIHHGTREVLGRVNLLDREELLPGEGCLCQLELETPLMALRGDHYVIRSYSPMFTIGGGVIIDPVPSKHKRYKDEVIKKLEVKALGDPKELVQQYLSSSQTGLATNKEVAVNIGLEEQLVTEQIEIMVEEGSLLEITGEGNKFLLWKETEEIWLDKVMNRLKEFHNKYPLRPGISKEELRSRDFSEINGKVFNLLLEYWERGEKIRLEEQVVALSDFSINPPPKIAKARDMIEEKLLSEPFAPPGWEEIAASANINEQEKIEVLAWLQYDQKIVKISDDIILHKKAMDQAIEKIREFLKENGTLQLAQARDLFKTSRKYALPLLEYLDQIKVTKRKADFRILF